MKTPELRGSIFVVYVGISTLHDPRPESNPRRHATDPAAFPLAPVLGRFFF